MRYTWFIQVLILMLLVEITNSKEMVASKNKLVARIASEKIDKNIVEAEVIKQMSQDLAAWGLEGNITIVQGLEVQGDGVLTRKGLTVKQRKAFGKNVKEASSEFTKPR